ncbi:hypothetical protein FVE67_06570 [Thermosulfurimonas marina]|uniref:DUF5714 domain-containing protein n=1 Tax=Thermosulfurimonas marina TaxID=2047767 RepID=A0A6H1WTG5_9BACT|nr:hypothetical protein FVE67_06570 [Thermosulfurimonas marina]
MAEITGPGCCKAYLWKALDLAVDFLRRSFPQYPLRVGPVTCLWFERHPHGCRKSKCPYWPGTNPLKEVSHETRNHHHH